jgi:hypothetical protein
LRISPNEWPTWTLRDFDLAYSGWREVNIDEPWQRARAISFYSLAPHSDVSRWTDVFKLDSDPKPKKKHLVVVREWTEEEKQIFESAINGQQLLN